MSNKKTIIEESAVLDATVEIGKPSLRWRFKSSISTKNVATVEQTIEIDNIPVTDEAKSAVLNAVAKYLQDGFDMLNTSAKENGYSLPSDE